MTNIRRAIATFSLVAILSTFVVSTAVADTFKDVLPGDQAYTAVEALAANGTIAKTADTFAPNAPLTRGEAAKYLVMEAGYELLNPASAHFPDVAVGSTYFQYIETAWSNGIITGFPDGTFKPAATVQRDQFAVMAVKAFDFALVTPAVATFTDVLVGNWAFTAVETAVENGVIYGMTPTVFAPADPITKGQGAMMTYRATTAVATEDEEDDDTSADFDENGTTEGSINTVTKTTADEDTVKEGESEVEVYALDVKLDDNGPLQLQRADFYFSETSNATAPTKPWEYFTEASVTVDGEIVATVDVNASSDWGTKTSAFIDLASNTTDTEYMLRVAGIEATLPSNETTKVALLLTAKDAYDSDEETAQWYIEASALRVMDETGFVSTELLGADNTQGFEVGPIYTTQRDMADFSFSESSDSPEGTVVQVDEVNYTEGVELVIAEVEEKNGVDVNVTEMTVTYAVDSDADGDTTSDSASSVIKKLYLLVDGTVVGFETVAASGTGTVTFDNIDFDIEGDSTVEISVKADFENIDDSASYDYTPGATVQVTIGSFTAMTDSFDNDEDDYVAGEKNLTIASEEFELRDAGIQVNVVSAKTTVTAGDSAKDDTVEFEWVLDITAFGDSDIYVDYDTMVDDATGALTTFTYGYGINSSTVILTDLDGTITESDSDVTANGTTSYKIAKGKTGTFTLNLSAANDGTASGQVQAFLSRIGWSKVAAGTSQAQYTFTLIDDSKTPYKSMN